MLATSILCIGGSGIAADAQPPAQSKGQTATDLCSLDLSAEIDSGAGRRLRVRLVTLEPGGVVAVHGHQDRPTIFYVAQGSLVSHWAGQPDRTLGVGECAAEGKDVTHHWMENTGSLPAKYIAADISK